MHKAGYNGSPIFSSSALRLLTRTSSGLPRKLTILADKSLLAAFAAQSKVVKAAHVRLAAKDSGPAHNCVTTKSMLLIALLLALLVLGGVFLNEPSLWPTVSGEKVKNTTILLPDIGVLKAEISSEMTNQTYSEDMAEQGASEPTDTGVTLEALTHKTQRWMSSSTGVVYTIQILSANVGDDEFLEHFFSSVAREIGLNELYVHPVSIDNKTFLAITLGSFSTHRQAATYLDSLPGFILRYQPYIKNIGSFRRGN